MCKLAYIWIIFQATLLGHTYALQQQACLGKSLNLICSPDKMLIVEEAIYGTLQDSSCGASTTNSTNCSSKKAIVWINKKCAGAPGCGIIVRHDTFKDLGCPQNSNNGLLVKYHCASYSNIHKICDKTSQQQLSQTEGYIMSHDIHSPAGYPASQKCSLDIPTGGTADYVTVNIFELSLEPSGNGQGCNDYLMLTDTSSTIKSETLCGEVYNLNIKPMNFSQLRIEFVTDNVTSTAYRGFLLHYTVYGFQTVIHATSASTMSENITTLTDIYESTPKANIETTSQFSTTTTSKATRTTTLSPWGRHTTISTTKKTTPFISTATTTTTLPTTSSTTSVTPIPTSTTSPTTSTLSSTISTSASTQVRSSSSSTTTMQSVTTTPSSTTSQPATKPTGTVVNGNWATACHGENFTLSCPLNSILIIKEAIYGIFKDSPCKPSNINELCFSQQSLFLLNERCSGREMCLFMVDSTLGFCPPGYSGLTVDFECVSKNMVYNICDNTAQLDPAKGYIISPNYPSNYGINHSCKKTLDPGPNSYISIQVLDINMQPRLNNQGCYDFLTITDPGNALKYNQYCGDIMKSGLKFTLELDVLSCEFHADGDISGLNKGFFLVYQVLSKTTTLPAISTTTAPLAKGCLSSESEGMCEVKCGRGMSLLNCPTGQTIIPIKASFGTLDQAAMRSCSATSAGKEICPNQDVSDKIISTCSGEKFCILNSVAYDHCSNMTSADVALAVDHKCAKNTNIIDICGNQTLPKNKGYIISPGYPNGYGSSLNCAKSLNPGNNYYIKLNIYDVNTRVKSAGGCNDYVQIAGKPQYCGKPAMFTISVDKLEIQFISDNITDSGFRGFLIGYDVIAVPIPETTTLLNLPSSNPTELKLTSLEPSKNLPFTTVPDVTSETMAEKTVTTTMTPIKPVETTVTTIKVVETTKKPALTVPDVISQTMAETTVTTTKTVKTTMTPIETTITTMKAVETTNKPALITTAESILDQTTELIIEDTVLNCNASRPGGYCTDRCSKKHEIHLQCDSSFAIYVYSAFYHGTTNDVCKTKTQSVSFTCDSVDVTAKISENCSGNKNCTIPAGTDFSKCNGDAPLRVEYKCVFKTDICSKHIMPSEGLISSPLFPKPYPSSQTCVRFLKPSTPESQVEINMIALDLEPRGTIGCYDMLILREKDKVVNYYIYCGLLANTGNPLTLNYTSLSITYRSDAFAQNMKGFLLHYRVISPPNITNAYIIPDVPLTTTVKPTTTTSTTSGPTTTVLTTTTTRPITTTIPVLTPNTSTNQSTLCIGESFSCPTDDIILIEDVKFGIFAQNQCGGTLPVTGSCDPNIALQVIAACTGFNKCNYTFTKQNLPNGCPSESALHIVYRCSKAPVDICSNQVLTLPEGLVASRNYPSKYTYNAQQPTCTKYIIPNSPNAHIVTRIYDLNIVKRPTTGCYDYLILEEENNPLNYFAYCGDLVTTTENLQQKFKKLKMTFRPDQIDHKKGFLLYYKVIGDITTTGPKSTTTILPSITSTPTTTTRSTQGTTTTTQPPKTTTMVTPNTAAYSVQLCPGESFSSNCLNTNDVILIEEAKFGVFTLNQCGGTAPITVSCDTNILLKVAATCTGFNKCTFPFNNQMLPQGCSAESSLLITYTCYKAPVDICTNEQLTLPEGLVASRNYPSTYTYNPQQTACTKHIIPNSPKAKIITRIYEIDLDKRTSSGCYDYLYLEQESNALKYFAYCGDLVSSTENLQQEFNQLKITFRPDQINQQKKGFLLYYKVIGDIPATTETTDESTTTGIQSTTKIIVPTVPITTTITTTPMTISTTKPSTTIVTSTTTPVITTTTMSTTTNPMITSTTVTSTTTPVVTTTTVPTTSTPVTTRTTMASTTTSKTATSKSSATQTTTGTSLEPTNSALPVSADEGLNGALIAGIVLAVFLVIFFIILGICVVIRSNKKQTAKMLKPNHRDLFANTHGAHVNAMNEYMYVDMQNPTHYDSSISLAAHESALSSPLYDANRNRNFSNPNPGERIIILNDSNSGANGGIAKKPFENGHSNSIKINSSNSDVLSSEPNKEELNPLDVENETSLNDSKLGMNNNVSNLGMNNNVGDSGPSYDPPPPPSSNSDDENDSLTEDIGHIHIDMNRSHHHSKEGNLHMEDEKPTSYETFSSA